jgi:hypothetical protein
MHHSSPLKPSVTLIHTTVGDLVQVQDRDVTAVSTAGPIKLKAGEVVLCLRNDEHGVLIARGNGSRLLVPVKGARTVGIRWFPDAFESDESIDGRSPDVQPKPEQRAGTSRSRAGRPAGRRRGKGDRRRSMHQDAPG